MQTLLAQYSTVLLLVGVAFILFSLRNTIRQFNQSRRAPYYILRDEASRSAGRWALISFGAIVVTLLLATYASQLPAGEPPIPSTPAASPTNGDIPTLGPPPTPTPTQMPPPSPTPTATPTLTPVPPPADLPDILLTPIPGAVAPDPAARFEFLTLASRLDDRSNPLDPGLQFPADAARVYVFFRASGVNNGAPWGIFCYRDGEIFDLFVGLWEDGPVTQTARAFCAHDGRPGAFRIRAYIATTFAFEVTYTLIEPPPAEASPTPTS
jgi:hypothetical protein